MANISVPFMLDFPYNDEIMEFDIKYNHEEDNIKDLLAFLKKYEDRKVNIELTESGIPMEEIALMYMMNPNVVLKIDERYIYALDEFRANGFKFYFTLFASNWDILNSLINAGVSEVYITGELGFDLLKVVAACSENNVRMRAIPNLAQASDPFETSERIKAFFIRPEDLEEYANYIDTFEFYYEDKKSKLKPLYQIYNISQKWYGNLNEIIAGLDIDLDSRRVLESFAFYRMNCHKSCYKGSRCEMCLRIKELSELLEQKNVIFTEGAAVESE